MYSTADEKKNPWWSYDNIFFEWFGGKRQNLQKKGNVKY